MNVVLRIAGQAALYGLVALVLGYLSQRPAYTHFPPGKSLIKVSFAHSGARLGGCRERTAEELAALPPNMRATLDCPRERVPLVFELELDGSVVVRREAPPIGLSRDGPSRLYERIAADPGRHHMRLALRDSEREAGFDYILETEILLSPGQSLAVGFRPETGGFTLM